MAIEPRLGITLIVLCVMAMVWVERDRQRRIARMMPPASPRPLDATGSDDDVAQP